MIFCPNRLRGERGVAAVEFAVAMPFLLVLLGGLSDLGQEMRAQARLANGVANAARYAFVTQGGAAAATLTGIVRSASTLINVSANASAATCACPSGSPVALVATACNGTCSDGTPPGSYVTISGSYVYAPLMPAYVHLANTTLTETVTVRVK